jgi:hypothetical protein
MGSRLAKVLLADLKLALHTLEFQFATKFLPCKTMNLLWELALHTLAFLPQTKLIPYRTMTMERVRALVQKREQVVAALLVKRHRMRLCLKRLFLGLPFVLLLALALLFAPPLRLWLLLRPALGLSGLLARL